MQDGAELVYEKQGNTGSAAYNQPTLRIGATPLDLQAERQYQENQLKEKENFILGQQKEKEKAAAFKPLAELDLSGWDVADKQELGGDLLNVRNRIAQLRSEDVIPGDYTNPKAQEYDKMMVGYQAKVNAAKEQKAALAKAQASLIADYDNPNPQFDREKSIANIQKYVNSPNIDARRAIDPNTLLVRKEVKPDILSPIKDLKVADYTGDYKVDNPQGGQSGNYLRKKELRNAIEANVNNPINEEVVAKSLVAGDFKNKDEYINYLYKQASDKFSPSTTSTIKEPAKGWNITNLEGASDGDLRKTFNFGDATAKVHSGAGSGQEEVVTMYNQTQLPNVEMSVSGSDAIDASTGNPANGTGDIVIKSGTLSTPLVFNTTGKIVAVPSRGKYNFKDTETGTIVELEGDKKSIENQLVAKGYASYKPMVKGLGKYVNDLNQEVSGTFYVDANKALPNTGEKNLTKTNATLAGSKILANRMNQSAIKNAGGSTTTVSKGKYKGLDKDGNPIFE